jgi:DNA-binding response OmpR family regulator
MLTAKGQESDREQGLSAGADEFLTKPFSPIGVVEKVRELLR